MKDYTWEDPPYGEEDQYEELCDNSKPSDFYFHVMEDIQEMSFGATIIAIVPKLYFHKEKCMWDQSMFLNHILPSDFNESMESIWDSDRSVDEIRSELLNLGFEENLEFSKLFQKDFE